MGSYPLKKCLSDRSISKLLIEKHSDTFELALSANGIRGAFAKGKIASLIGLEGWVLPGNILQAVSPQTLPRPR